MARAPRTPSTSTSNSGESRLPLIKRPPKATFEKLCDRRIPVHYLHAGLTMQRSVCQQTQKIMQELAIRHLDFSVPYWNQSEANLDFFKREVLLHPDLRHLTRYEGGWPVEVLTRLLFHKRSIFKGLQQLVEPEEVQHEYCLRRRIPTGRPNARVFKEKDPTPSGDLDVQVPMKTVEAVTTTSSRLTVLSTLLGSVTPSLSRFYSVITQAGLSADEELDHFLRLTATSRERFIKFALADYATSFQQVAVMEVLEQMKNST